MPFAVLEFFILISYKLGPCNESKVFPFSEGYQDENASHVPFSIPTLILLLLYTGQMHTWFSSRKKNQRKTLLEKKKNLQLHVSSKT